MSNKPETILVLHCGGDNWGVGDAESVRRYHVDVNHWQDIGYHYVILNGKTDRGRPYLYNADKDGVIEVGRPENKNGAHEPRANDCNKYLGILLVCTSAKHATQKQNEAVLELIDRINGHKKVIAIKQHSDFRAEKWYCAGYTPDQMAEFNRYLESLEL